MGEREQRASSYHCSAHVIGVAAAPVNDKKVKWRSLSHMMACCCRFVPHPHRVQTKEQSPIYMPMCHFCFMAQNSVHVSSFFFSPSTFSLNISTTTYKCIDLPVPLSTAVCTLSQPSPKSERAAWTTRAKAKLS